MIFVFKTSVKTQLQIEELKPHIDKILPKAKWNFDLEDNDKIFRISSEENITSTILNLLKGYNYACAELE